MEISIPDAAGFHFTYCGAAGRKISVSFRDIWAPPSKQDFGAKNRLAQCLLNRSNPALEDTVIYQQRNANVYRLEDESVSNGRLYTEKRIFWPKKIICEINGRSMVGHCAFLFKFSIIFHVGVVRKFFGCLEFISCWARGTFVSKRLGI